MTMHSVTFLFDRETMYKLGKRLGHEGTPATSMELSDYIRYIVRENINHNDQDDRPKSLRIKKRNKRL